MKKLVLIFIFPMLQSCAEKPKIVITKTYITNGYWKSGTSNFFVVERMKLKKDRTLNIFAPEFKDAWDAQEKLETDSSFMYTFSTNLINKLIPDTVYFGSKNDGRWASGTFLSPSSKSDILSIGDLEVDTWYKFSRLRADKFYVYVFVDSSGVTHQVEQNLSNY